MPTQILTSFQLFVLGLSFGVLGPCFLSCAPVLIIYIAGKQAKWKQSLGDILIFSSGRLLAYLILGYLAGLSGRLLRQFSSLKLVSCCHFWGGAVIMLLGVLILLNRQPNIRPCRFIQNKITNLSSLFALGFIMGISPCLPLSGLLFEIALISENALGGMLYALFFGLGTFISGVVIIGSLAGLSTWLPQKILRYKAVELILRIICGLLLISWGLLIIIKF